jgi:hypothetical protein
MEGNIVLGHEFVMDDLFAILPPTFPFFRVASCDAQIPNGYLKLFADALKEFRSRKMTLTIHRAPKWLSVTNCNFLAFRNRDGCPDDNISLVRECFDGVGNAIMFQQTGRRIDCHQSVLRIGFHCRLFEAIDH